MVLPLLLSVPTSAGSVGASICGCSIMTAYDQVSSSHFAWLFYACFLII